MTDALTQVSQLLNSNQLLNSTTGQQVAAAQTVGQGVNQLLSALGTGQTISTSALSDLSTHVSTQLSNLIPNLTTAQNYTNAANVFGVVSPSLAATFGSITGQGSIYAGMVGNQAINLLGTVAATAGGGAVQAIQNAISNGSIDGAGAVAQQVFGLTPTTASLSQLASSLTGVLNSGGGLGSAAMAIGNLGGLSPLVSILSNVSNLTNLGSLTSGANLPSLLTNLVGSQSALGSLTGLLGGMGGGGLTGILSTIGGGGLQGILSSGLTSSLGSLTSISGNITQMISGELGSLTSMAGGLTSLAGVSGLSGLLSGGAGGLASSVLKNVGINSLVAPDAATEMSQSTPTNSTSNDSSPCSDCTIPQTTPTTKSNNSTVSPQAAQPNSATPAGTQNTPEAQTNTVDPNSTQTSTNPDSGFSPGAASGQDSSTPSTSAFDNSSAEPNGISVERPDQVSTIPTDFVQMNNVSPDYVPYSNSVTNGPYGTLDTGAFGGSSPYGTLNTGAFSGSTYGNLITGESATPSINTTFSSGAASGQDSVSNAASASTSANLAEYYQRTN